MKIIVHSMVSDNAIKDSLGADDYSYFFARRYFVRSLVQFAQVVTVSDPAVEVDPIYDAARAEDKSCVFLSFVPPHKTILHLRCPVVPVFAWEFSTIPNEVWGNDIRNDWRAVFAVCQAAIVHSSYTAKTIRAAMGQEFPIAAIPAPVFENFERQARRATGERVELRIAGTVLDTALDDTFRHAPVWPRRPVPLLTPGPLPSPLLPISVPDSFVIVGRDNESARHLTVAPEDGSPLQPRSVVLTSLQAVAVTVREPEDAAEPRIGWRRRVQITRHFGLEWYRLAVRDLLPGPVRSANALAGRTMHRVHGRLRPRRPAHPDRLLSVETSSVETALEPPEAIEATPLVTVQAEPGPDPIADPSPSSELVRVAVPLPALPPASPPVPPPTPPAPIATVALDGVVFVSMFSPRDGRKNWNDIVTAFCWAHRDTSDATLVLKIVATDHGYEPGLRQLLEELAPFRCRVVVLHGYLETPEYQALIGAASFYVNASHCEGLCLPMTEFMSAGTPAIAPNHTAFEDYISPDNALVIDSGIENTVWPGDGRDLFRTTRYRIDWHGLMLAYREGYQVAKTDPERYRAMSDDARETMRRFCGIEPVTEALRTVLSGWAGAGLEHAA